MTIQKKLNMYNSLFEKHVETTKLVIVIVKNALPLPNNKFIKYPSKQAETVINDINFVSIFPQKRNK